MLILDASSAEELDETSPRASDTIALESIAKQLVALGEEDQRDRTEAMSAGFDDAKLAYADRRRPAD
ncbi:hypothetical protein [Pseudoxanthomonas dokdonensis]|nr:hypothetical protein [Pseudoxanthomonas dokdonensis]